MQRHSRDIRTTKARHAVVAIVSSTHNCSPILNIIQPVAKPSIPVSSANVRLGRFFQSRIKNFAAVCCRMDRQQLHPANFELGSTDNVQATRRQRFDASLAGAYVHLTQLCVWYLQISKKHNPATPQMCTYARSMLTSRHEILTSLD
jgi:hypothetical protein